ncbi:hypothetical protein ACFOLC_11550 [Lysobacter cavernae]|uniref:Secreted protein n=1 Tax=Lysobacter cavernae TaxID=1685901 RepID=A0ABV7RSD9_9GAMM
MRLALTLLAAVSLPVSAADPKPEINRGTVQPQAVNAVHTLRQIPEACARIEGMFTGQAADPYKFAVVRTSPTCQPRARFVDAAKVKPSEQTGWKFNDLIRVPNAVCPSQQAVVRVWRKPAATAVPPKLDAQGQARIYLQDSKQVAATNKMPAVPVFAAAMSVEGKACGG